jgi:hypothetical protein|tara:strand:- start:1309 stop:1911 length:603 start_codon:yes stop_codon:yes gene_type:complete
MAYNYKITDLKFRINKLIPQDKCKFLISIFEKYKNLSHSEESYKFKTNKVEQDNFLCLNLSMIDNPNQDIKKALTIAKEYLTIMIFNYVNYIKVKKICPFFNDAYINSSSNIRILKYETGQSIADHSDVDYKTRASCTLNLNEDYEGGEFSFFNGQIKETFKTGDGMIFPAEPIWIHGTEPITKGTRYTINCFLHSAEIK